MKVLGYNGGLDGYPARFGSGHDSSAAIVVDGRVVAACEEERFTREKHTPAFPKNAIDYCLREAGLKDASELDLVTYFYSYPLMWHRGKLEQGEFRLPTPLKPLARAAIHTMNTFNRVAGYGNDRNRKRFERMVGARIDPKKYEVVPHHVAHAASAYYDSPLERALCATFDAEGESASGIVAVANGTKLNVLGQTYAPNSLGYLYQYITMFLGFERRDEYKVMGLAPYGDPSRYRDWFKNAVRLMPDGQYSIDPVFVIWLQIRDALFYPKQKGYPKAITDGLGPPRDPDEELLQKHMDIAASLQECLENTIFHVLRHAQKTTGEKNLCMAGGVALNCTLNGKIARSGLFDRMWIHPAAHDPGTALGSALFGYHNVLKQPREPKIQPVYLGPAYENLDVRKAVAKMDGQIFHREPADLANEVARLLADGKVVGWYQGRMEWGPRALGNRSILADPRRDDMKDIVNHAVKLREGFRPFAPACLAEEADEWFDMTGLEESPYMLYVVPVKPEKRAQIPAVTHVDGSARVQTVTREQNPKFHALIEAFYRQTGVPVVLNTSFNVKGEPIVNTPEDAMKCFLGTQIDVLVLGDVIVEKQPHVVQRIRTERGTWGENERGRVIDGRIAQL